MKQSWSEFKINFKQLPLDIKSLFWFSLMISIAGELLGELSDRKWYEEIIPYTGWSPGSSYEGVVLILVILVFAKKNITKMGNVDLMRVFAIFQLGIRLNRGIRDWLNALPEDYILFNPYLRYDPLRPIYSIFLPLFWILIIGWPLLKGFLNKKRKATV